MGKKSRVFLLELSLVNMVLGGLFFTQPVAASSLWAWTVKPLAVRFLGATFLAITLGCWSALRAKAWQRGKILVLVGAAFFGLAFLITLSVALSPGMSVVAWVWALYFAAASLGLFAILKAHGWYRRPQDRIHQDSPWPAAKILFRIQTILVGLFGSFMLFLPQVAHEQFWPWDVVTPCNCFSTLQTFAALFLATCLATGWASIQTEKARIRALLPLDAIFPSLALLAVGLHWGVVESESPSTTVTGVWLFVYSFVAVGSAYLLYASRTKS